MKICKKCNIEKPINNFGKNNRTKDRFANLCKACDSVRVSEWQKNNSIKYKESLKKRRFKRHNTTEENCIKLYVLQNKSCSMCNVKFDLDSLNIDHDHSCCPGQYSCGSCIRGLLCSPCNLFLGMYEKNPKSLKGLIKYINANMV